MATFIDHSIKKSNVQFADSANLDAFGNQRVSTTGQRLDVEFIYDKQPYFMDEVLVTGGTVTHNANERDLTLAINNTTSGSEARMSSYPVPYTAGNSQKIDMSFVLNLANIAGNTSCYIRSKVTGTVVETVIKQSSWKNLKTGIDWSKSQLLQIDFQSLKVGRIRFYIVKNGLPVLIYKDNNDNIRNSGYWQSPSLPIFWRIYNDATYTYMEVGYGDENNGIGFRHRITKNATATMKAICGTVKSEGGEDISNLQGIERSADRGTSTVTVGTTLIPIISIRPRATLNSLPNLGLLIPESFDIQVDNAIRYVIVHNATLTGATWTNVDTLGSATEYDISATAFSGGHVVGSGYIGTRRNVEASKGGLLSKTILFDRKGTESGILTLCAVRTTASSASTLAQIGFREIR